MYLLALIVGGGVLLILGRAFLTGRSLQLLQFELIGLVPVAVIPQLLAFYVPATRVWVPDLLAPVILVWSQIVLLGFIWINRKRPGMLFLGLGLAMNFLVILANGGMMPVTPDTATSLSGFDAWSAGARFGPGKGVVLPTDATAFWDLSDRFLLPDWFPYEAAYSLGDVLIVLGALALLWAMSNGPKRNGKQNRPEQIRRPLWATNTSSEYEPQIGG
ncbi:MAG TPA: DUF5317 domain-containing protein [Candidatus Sulfomarinibacteraceae bacterium]|nr:DUF5317 domain-containing protein [Candidatus Sulfomarinibacteraceae bacterium]